MNDAHGSPLNIGDRVRTVLDDGCVPVGSIGRVKDIRRKPRDWMAHGTGTHHAKVESADFVGWYDSPEIEVAT